MVFFELAKIKTIFAKVRESLAKAGNYESLLRTYTTCKGLPSPTGLGSGRRRVYRRISVWYWFSSLCGAVLRTFTFPFVGSRPSKAPHHCCFGSGGCAPKTKGTAAIQKTDAKTSKRTAQDHKEGHGEDVKENGSQDLERPRSMPDELP